MLQKRRGKKTKGGIPSCIKEFQEGIPNRGMEVLVSYRRCFRADCVLTVIILPVIQISKLWLSILSRRFEGKHMTGEQAFGLAGKPRERNCVTLQCTPPGACLLCGC